MPYHAAVLFRFTVLGSLALSKSGIDLKRKILTVNKAVVFDVSTPIVKTGAKMTPGTAHYLYQNPSLAF
ncbi:hypothetical protein D3Z36_10265 [Lachnospiraceae bacterium]|nr:hypothetical protein [Lachnospiraceae bacterium]